MAAESIRYRIADLADIPEKGVVLSQAGELQIGVFKVKGKLYAYENRCAHQGGPVCRGDVVGRFEEPLGEGGASLGLVESEERIDIACPWHGWEYDVETGEHIADREIKLRSFPVYEEDGAVFVDVA
jgi:nitrite reductase/ring-hydroxylating ferredoxin subunit